MLNFDIELKVIVKVRVH